MKAGYTVRTINLSNIGNIIEVTNYAPTNSVLNFKWLNYSYYLNSRDKTSVGVWKIKKK